MEIFVFGILVLAAVVFLLWWGRRGGSGSDAVLQDDLRDKNVGMVGLPNRGQTPWHSGGQGGGDFGGGGGGGSTR
jgi:hypothetical protein